MKFTGGIRYGESYLSSFNATWPFASLKLEPGHLTLSALGKTFSFAHADLDRISKYRGFISKGIRFEHNSKNYPPFIVFWTFSQKSVLAELIGAGFTVNEHD